MIEHPAVFPHNLFWLLLLTSELWVDPPVWMKYGASFPTTHQNQNHHNHNHHQSRVRLLLRVITPQIRTHLSLYGMKSEVSVLSSYIAVYYYQKLILCVGRSEYCCRNGSPCCCTLTSKDNKNGSVSSYSRCVTYKYGLSRFEEWNIWYCSN